MRTEKRKRKELLWQNTATYFVHVFTPHHWYQTTFSVEEHQCYSVQRILHKQLQKLGVAVLSFLRQKNKIPVKRRNAVKIDSAEYSHIFRTHLCLIIHTKYHSLLMLFGMKKLCTNKKRWCGCGILLKNKFPVKEEKIQKIGMAEHSHVFNACSRAFAIHTKHHSPMKIRDSIWYKHLYRQNKARYCNLFIFF